MYKINWGVIGFIAFNVVLWLAVYCGVSLIVRVLR